MDVVTQGVLGAALAQACAPARRQRVAALAGAVGGLLPDADIFIRSATDPLLSLEYHRHFTHSLVAIPFGGVLAASVTWLLLRGRRPWRELLAPALLGWATHGLLDACTSYGTHLTWPFDQHRAAWNLISILDPLFTVPLLWGCLRGVRRRTRLAPALGLALALAYLGACSVQHMKAEVLQSKLVQARGHAAVGLELKPSLANNIVFRSFYEWEGEYWVDAIRVPWWGAGSVHPGERHPVLDTQALIERFELDEVQRADLERFRHFSDGCLIEDRRFEGVVGDFRYAAVPDSVAPLWGIGVDGLAPGEHVRFGRFSTLDARMRGRFVDLLLGRTEEPRPDGAEPGM